MIRKPGELAESIREAVDHRAVLLSHMLLAVTVAVHTALDPASLGYQIVLAIILSTAMILLILLRVFDLGTVNKRPLAYIIFYQIFVFLGISFISDAATPYLVGVFLVAITSNLYYGARGVWATVACFGVTSIVKYFYLSSTLHIGINGKLNIIVGFIMFLAVCSLYINYQKVFDWDRAKLKKTEAELISSINSLELGFIITNKIPEVTQLNNAAHELLCGSQEHSAAHCPVVTMDHLLTTLGASSDLKATLANSLTSKAPKVMKSVDFKDRNWRVFISPMHDGASITGAAIVVQDTTDEYILNRSRDEFFSIASHELRTPLTAIRGNASMMLEYYPEISKNPELKEMVDDVQESSERLILIVNDFLDVSRLEQRKITYKLEELSLKELVSKVVQELHAANKTKKVAVTLARDFDDLPKIIADKDRLTQVVYNIIGNAIKFTENGSVAISANKQGELITVRVTDTGRGIDKKMQVLLFHKFQQAGESLLTRDTTKGTGLGLYVSKLLMEGMHGKLSLLSSEPDKGSTFTFSIPIATPEQLKKLEA